MALPISFLEDLRHNIPMIEVVGRRVPLTRVGRTYKACCPFHGEKTPSFYVYPDHAHCFGCGWHGDLISFVMQTEGLDFLEAVAQLAGLAGLTVPQDEAQATSRAAQRDMGDVLAAVESLFVRWLAEPGGEAGRAYLAGRGLDEQTIAAFGIGWSGPRGALAQDLPITKLVEAGLMYRREEDGVAVDFFRDRIMFPIRDQAGRVVSFGGRTLGDAQPKYINGPETAVYAKRRMLYGLDKAREAFRLGKPLIVVEGYLDVIAMHSVGETGTVAPLGSALTDEQLDELWRLSPAPILLFDGDAAGQRATGHVMEIALPKLAAQRTLQICTLEAGDDPDGLLKRAGVAALRLVLDGARPLVAALAEALRPAESGRLALAVWRNRIGLAADMIQDAAVCQDHRRALLNFYFEQVGEQWTSTAA